MPAGKQEARYCEPQIRLLFRSWSNTGKGSKRRAWPSAKRNDAAIWKHTWRILLPHIRSWVANCVSASNELDKDQLHMSSSFDPLDRD